MTDDDRLCLCKVRLLALQAEVNAGGEPSPRRYERVLAPIVDRPAPAAPYVLPYVVAALRRNA